MEINLIVDVHYVVNVTAFGMILWQKSLKCSFFAIIVYQLVYNDAAACKMTSIVRINLLLFIICFALQHNHRWLWYVSLNWRSFAIYLTTLLLALWLKSRVISQTNAVNYSISLLLLLLSMCLTCVWWNVNFKAKC